MEIPQGPGTGGFPRLCLWLDCKGTHEMSFKLWGRYTSARSLKVILALAELGIEYQLIQASATMGPGGSVSKGNQAFGVVGTPEFQAMNPNGRIPTIDDDGFVLWESNTIVRYLGMKYNPTLFYGDDLYTFALAGRWLDFENNNIIPGQHIVATQLYRIPAEKRDPAKLTAACENLEKEFSKVENQLAKTEYIAGDQWTMGDIAMAIRVHRWHLSDIERPDMPNITRYYETIKKRPAFSVVADPAYHAEG
jgi:glutathione S-transferase